MISVKNAEEVETARREGAAPVLLLQVGASSCKRCPPVADALRALSATHEFTWLYCDAHADTDLPELYGVSRLPAVVLVDANADPGAEPHVLVQATAEQVVELVHDRCARVLVLDEDF